MTDKQIAAALADADNYDKACLYPHALSKHVRALAAEVQRLRAERDRLREALKEIEFEECSEMLGLGCSLAGSIAREALGEARKTGGVK